MGDIEGGAGHTGVTTAPPAALLALSLGVGEAGAAAQEAADSAGGEEGAGHG